MSSTRSPFRGDRSSKSNPDALSSSLLFSTVPLATDQVISLRQQFEQRLSIAVQEMHELIEAIKSDEIIPTLGSNKITSEQARERIVEIIENALHSEQENEINRLMLLVANRESEIRILDRAASSLKNELEQAQAHLADAERKKQLYQSRVETHARVLPEAESRITELEDLLAIERRTVRELRETLSEKVELADRLERKLSRYENEREEFRKVRRDLKERAELMDRESGEIRFRIESSIAQVEHLLLTDAASEVDISLQITRLVESLFGDHSSLVDSLVLCADESMLDRATQFRHTIKELFTRFLRYHKESVEDVGGDAARTIEKLQSKLIKYRKRFQDEQDESNARIDELNALLQAERKNCDSLRKMMFEKVTEAEERVKKSFDARYSLLQDQERMFQSRVSPGFLSNDSYSQIPLSEHIRLRQMYEERISAIQQDSIPRVDFDIRMRELENRYVLEAKEAMAKLESEWREKFILLEKEKDVQMNDSLQALQSGILHLEMHLDAEKKKSTQYERDIEELRNQSSREREKLQEVESHRSSLVSHLDEASANLSRLKNVAESEKKKVVDIRNRLETILSEKNIVEERLFSTEDLLRSTRSEKERLLSEIQTIRQKMDKDEENRKIEFSHQIRSLELQLAHFRSENENLRDRMQRLVQSGGTSTPFEVEPFSNNQIRVPAMDALSPDNSSKAASFSNKNMSSSDIDRIKEGYVLEIQQKNRELIQMREKLARMTEIFRKKRVSIDMMLRESVSRVRMEHHEILHFVRRSLSTFRSENEAVFGTLLRRVKEDFRRMQRDRDEDLSALSEKHEVELRRYKRELEAAQAMQIETRDESLREMRLKNDKLRKEVDQMQSKCSMLEDTIRALEESGNRLDKEKRDLQRKLSSLNVERDRLSPQRLEQPSGRQEFNSQSVTTIKTFLSKIGEILEIDYNVDAILGLNDFDFSNTLIHFQELISDRVSTRERSHRRSKEDIERLERELSSLREENEKAKISADSLRKEREYLEDKVSQLEAETSSLSPLREQLHQAELRSSQMKIDYESEIARIRQRLDANIVDIDRPKSGNGDKSRHSNLSDLNSSVIESQDTESKYARKYSQAKHELQKCIRERDRLLEENQSLRDKIEKLERSVKKREDEIARLRSHLKELTLRKSTSLADNESLLDDIRNSLRDREEQLEKEQEQKKRLISQLVDKDKEVERLRGDLNSSIHETREKLSHSRLSDRSAHELSPHSSFDSLRQLSLSSADTLSRFREASQAAMSTSLSDSSSLRNSRRRFSASSSKRSFSSSDLNSSRGSRTSIASDSRSIPRTPGKLDPPPDNPLSLEDLRDQRGQNVVLGRSSSTSVIHPNEGRTRVLYDHQHVSSSPQLTPKSGKERSREVSTTGNKRSASRRSILSEISVVDSSSTLSSSVTSPSSPSSAKKDSKQKSTSDLRRSLSAIRASELKSSTKPTNSISENRFSSSPKL